jgi:hypothetical protein
MSYYMRVTHQDSLVFAREITEDPTTPQGAILIEEYANILDSTGADLEIQVFDLDPTKAVTRTKLSGDEYGTSANQGTDETPR